MSDAKVRALEIALRAVLKTACDQGLILDELKEGAIQKLHDRKPSGAIRLDMAVHEIELASAALSQ